VQPASIDPPSAFAMSLVTLFLWFGGRITRRLFWLGQLGFTALSLLLWWSLELGGEGRRAAMTPALAWATAAMVWAFLAVSVKRLHDRDRSGWWMLLLLVPVVGTIWYWVELGLLGGDDGPNRFGDDPRQRGTRLRTARRAGGYRRAALR
jgi:uncharacterized membrane protein YhaH (DUF805 family)